MSGKFGKIDLEILSSKSGFILEKIKVQSNSVIANSTGPSVFVRYNRDIVITVRVDVVQ